MTTIVPLGTNGFFPSYGRQTMSFLVLTDDQAFLLDAGTGVSRLVEPPVSEFVTLYDDLDIVFSHYHLDHVIGLSYLPEAWTGGQIRVFGPAAPLVDSDPETALDRLLGPPLFSARYSSFPAPVQLTAVRDEQFRIGDFAVRMRRQNHPSGSVSIRLGDDIAYLTDTPPDPAGVEFVRGVKLLLHELWLTDEQAAQTAASGHSSFSEVAEFVKAAGPRSVMLVHHHPRRTNQEIVELSGKMQQVTGVPCAVPEEARVFKLD